MIVLDSEARFSGSQAGVLQKKPHERGAGKTERKNWKRDKKCTCILNIQGRMTDRRTCIYTLKQGGRRRDRDKDRQWGKKKKRREIERQREKNRHS